jgi:hypothetical protein
MSGEGTRLGQACYFFGVEPAARPTGGIRLGQAGWL